MRCTAADAFVEPWLPRGAQLVYISQPVHMKFKVAMSRRTGLAFAGIGSAFWALLAGLVVRLVLRPGTRSGKKSA